MTLALLLTAATGAWGFGTGYWTNFYNTSSRCVRPVLGF